MRPRHEGLGCTATYSDLSNSPAASMRPRHEGLGCSLNSRMQSTSA
ncbi:MAG: hypothetical protein OJF58_001483 [Enhydrobacter sp.]|nr:MAG: hypothetical protein OJF58_001483 [Enhydrobacter sp.]